MRAIIRLFWGESEEENVSFNHFAWFVEHYCSLLSSIFDFQSIASTALALSSYVWQILFRPASHLRSYMRLKIQARY